MTEEEYQKPNSEIRFEPAATAATQEEFKMLVAIPSPRDIPDFRKTIDECLPQYDKVWFKHFSEDEEPYIHIRKYFLSHWQQGTKYTHLAILPDDIILNRKGVDKLVSNVKKNPDKYRVMMGTFTMNFYSDQLALTRNLPSREHKKRVYDSYKKDEVKGEGIISVGWCGTPFAIIDGKLIADGIVTLENDSAWNPNGVYYGSQDVILAHELYEHNIPLWADTDVFFMHLKGLPIAKVRWLQW